MLKLRDGIVELYRKAVSTVPTDVEEALNNALNLETDPGTKDFFTGLIEKIRSMRQQSVPLCGDIGIPTFWVRAPRGLSMTAIVRTIREATTIATEKIPLQHCAVDVVNEEISPDNTGSGFPIIYIEESNNDTLRIDLLLKGADCEVLGRTYTLPDEETGAERSLEGVRKVVIDAIKRTGGRGCLPFVIGIGIGGSRDQVSVLAKMQLFRRLTDSSEIPSVARLERELLDEANKMRLSWMRGVSSIIGIKIGINHRHISSYIVDVSFSCWATRRVRLIW